ncbi:MAG: alpha-amylase [Cyclobacteriaceae bacterium]
MSKNHLHSNITYQIFIPSFADSNGDGIGDINGIISKLDYFVDLRIDSLWLSPIHSSPSYHKYDVVDYYSVDESYGSIEHFKNLVSSAHQKGIKIIIDLVLNHCSSQHHWFQEALSGNAFYKDFFIWSTQEQIEAEGSLTKEKSADSDNIYQWNKVEGGDELYFSFFWKEMPDLNYDNPEVRKEVFKIGTFWLEEMGVDGFRLDAAKHIYPETRIADCHAFWREFKQKMQVVKSDVHLLGEVWTDLQEQVPFTLGFTSLFNFDLSYSILETVKRERIIDPDENPDSWKLHERLSLLEIISAYEETLKKTRPDFISTTFLTNHDIDRVMSFLGESEEKAKLAASILFTLPGSPCIYYGEEIGMKGTKPDEYIREPFLWAKGDRQNSAWIQSKYNLESDAHTLHEQKEGKPSIYQHYKSLIKLRKSNSSLELGKFAPYPINQGGIIAYLRSDPNSQVLVIHNLTKEEKIIRRIAAYQNVFYTTGLDLTSNIESFALSPYSSLILSK